MITRLKKYLNDSPLLHKFFSSTDGTNAEYIVTGFVDNNGNTFNNRQADNKLRISSSPIGYDIAEGQIPGHTGITQLGYNNDVDNVREDLWEVGGTYVFPETPIQMKISSTSANDTSAGTGARTVDIHYLDTNYTEQSETIILNGITPVNTVATNILRINDIHVMTVGSGGVSDGSLSLQNIAGTITYGSIGAGGNASRQAIYTVPTGKTFYITAINVGVGNASGNRFAEFSLRATTSRDHELTPGVFHFKSMVAIQDSAIFIPFCVPLKCISQSDVKLSVVSDSVSANAICAGHFCGWLEDD